MQHKAHTAKPTPGQPQFQVGPQHQIAFVAGEWLAILFIFVVLPIVAWKVLRGLMGYRRVVIVRKER